MQSQKQRRLMTSKKSQMRALISCMSGISDPMEDSDIYNDQSVLSRVRSLSFSFVIVVTENSRYDTNNNEKERLYDALDNDVYVLRTKKASDVQPSVELFIPHPFQTQWLLALENAVGCVRGRSEIVLQLWI